ncbi:hypothetical protein BDZ45DRAFT_60477 [Acephala macrosclerotiorum]|nr:hypothetical protein BDZ45DRAFT_60477 [Acephala macrosclerotiorum]
MAVLQASSDGLAHQSLSFLTASSLSTLILETSTRYLVSSTLLKTVSFRISSICFCASIYLVIGAVRVREINFAESVPIGKGLGIFCLPLGLSRV